jgi:peptidoglycan/LPS O-acetylase OafA/YrhL
VDLFFTLSGFFIGGILIDHRQSPRLTRTFYVRRAARILPLYYLTLLVLAAAVLAHLPGAYHVFPAWVYPLFLTNFALGYARTWDWLPLSVLWSLAVEEQFYLAAPWVARATRPPRLPWLLGGLVVLAEVLRIGLLLLYPNGAFVMHVLTPFRMDALALGVLVAWAVRSPAARPFLARLEARWPLWLGAGLGLLAGLDLLQPREGSRLLGLFGYLLIASVFALLVAVVARVQPRLLVGFLASRPLVHLGRRSYFIYLWHGLLGSGIIRLLGGTDFVLNSPAGAALVALAAGATWIASVGSWRWLEAPCVAWGHRHAY